MKNPNFPIFDTRKHYQFCKMSQKKQKSGVKIQCHLVKNGLTV